MKSKKNKDGGWKENFVLLKASKVSQSWFIKEGVWPIYKQAKNPLHDSKKFYQINYPTCLSKTFPYSMLHKWEPIKGSISF